VKAAPGRALIYYRQHHQCTRNSQKTMRVPTTGLTLFVAMVTLLLALDAPARSEQMPYSLHAAASGTHADDHVATDPSSTYVELDSWVYPAIERLAAQGVIKYPFLGLRPWTRRAIYQMLAAAPAGSAASAELVDAIRKGLSRETALGSDQLGKDIFIEDIYSRTQVISGTPLNDSYHFGQTLVDDFGRPYAHGWQQLTGFVTRAEHGRLSVFVRGEYQRSPSVPGYSTAVAGIIAVQDNTPIQIYSEKPANDDFRLLDAYASVEFLGQQFSLGKQSYWWGPGSGSAMMLSDNAEPIYSFRIDRTLPLYIPLLSRLLGPFRYDNFFGKLSGHLYPRQPYFYGQKVNFSPTRNLELGFSRDAVIAGDGSTPLTFGNFWKSFTSTSSGTGINPTHNINGARHASFDFRYRLPGLRNWLTLYSDSLIHDDISPADAPRHAAITPGIYLTRFPFFSKLDLHVEGGSSDITVKAEGGKFYYYEFVYRDCYLNKRNLMGSWLGREGTGGQAWATYWFNPHTTLQFGYRGLRVSPFFVPQGERQQAAYGELRYRWQGGLALQLMLQAERWAAPALVLGPQVDVSTQFQLSFSPKSWKLALRQPFTSNPVGQAGFH
jgi:Capsule assembly protein Wzi